MTALPHEQPARPHILPPQYDAIPTELKAPSQWVAFRYEWDERKDDWNKAPRTPRTGRLASTTNPATWGTFDEARAAAERGDFDGIGFVFTANDPYAGIDLDHCRDPQTGILQQWARQIVEDIPGYWEVSPRSEGIKAIVKATMAPNSKHKTPSVEQYDQGRYFTLTGHRLPDTVGTIMERQVEFDTLYRKTFPDINTERKDPKGASKTTTLDDHSIIDRAMAASNGAKFARLWRGDTTDYSGDESAADLSLCSLIAFWTGPDPSRIDSLFRQSGLMREKWDSQRPQGTYGSMTINRALSERTQFYTPLYTPPLRLVGSGTSSKDKDDHTDGNLPTEDDAIHFTDMWNAQRLVMEHGGNFRWCKSLGSWLVWDGARWVTDDTYGIMRYAKLTTRFMLAEAAKAPTDERMKALGKHALKSQSESRLNAMINLAKSEPGIAAVPEAFDADPWLLNVRNGTVDLRTGKCRDHRHEDLLTKIAPVVYDQHATCPTFLRFLRDIMKGRDELVDFMQHAIGYTLVGTTREQVMLILHGGGANGKSTLIETLIALLGDYARSMPSDALMVKRGDDGPKNEIARLRGVRLAAAVESDEGRRFSEAFVKQITGSDTVTVRHLYNDFFDMRPEFTVWLSTNHKPQIKNTDHGIWRRIRLVPFDVTFKDKASIDAGDEGVLHKDEYMLERLREELPGILNWVIAGCMAWQRDGLPVPAPVIQATEGYRAEMDLVAAWVADCCVEIPTVECKAVDLHKSYAAWCEENGERSMSARALGPRLNERGVTPKRGAKGVRMWCGIGLRADTSQPRETGEI